MKRQVVPLFMVILALAMVAMIGEGITGLVIYDEMVGDVCSIDNECGAKMCCHTGNNLGVCTERSSCNVLLKDVDSTEDFNQKINNIISEENRSGFQIILGMVVILMMVCSIYIIYPNRK